MKLLTAAMAALMLLNGCGAASAQKTETTEAGTEAAAETSGAAEAETSAADDAVDYELPEGVVPVTWEPSEDNLIIQSDEARELRTGRIINSAVVFSFGDKPKEVYEKLRTMTGKNGDPYVATAEETTAETKTAA